MTDDDRRKELGESVQIVRCLDLRDGFDQSFIGSEVAAAHAGQSKGFRERAEDNEIRVCIDEIYDAFLLGKLHVSFIDEYDIVSDLQHFLDKCAREQIACRIVRIANDGHLRLVSPDRFQKPLLIAPVSGKILDLDGRCTQRFRAKLIHVEGRAVDQDLIARIKEGPQKIADHFIPAIAYDEVLRLRADVVRQRFTDVIGHRLRVDLRAEGIESLDELFFHAGDGQDIQIVFIRIDDMLFCDRRHEVRIKVSNRFSKPFSLHHAPPSHEREPSGLLLWRKSEPSWKSSGRPLYYTFLHCCA